MCGVDKKRKKSIKMERIITSLLETDMYKFSMGQAIYHQFSDYKTTWSFKCRNTDVFFTKEMVDEIKRQIQLYCDLRFTEEELEYLHNIKWIKGSYVDFLRLWKARYEDFEISDDAECGLMLDAQHFGGITVQNIHHLHKQLCAGNRHAGFNMADMCRPHISHCSQLLLRQVFPYARFHEPRAYKCVVYHTNKSPADEVFLTCIVCAFCSCFNILNVQPPIYL